MTIPKILSAVWGGQQGYVFISTLKRSLKKKGIWRDHSFRWPQEYDRIDQLIKEYKSDHEMYWAPAVFTAPRRLSTNVESCVALWADLDPVPPSQCFIKPSIAWESSPQRFQAIWLLKDPVDSRGAEELNKRLTYAVGADKSGWDLPQVLRIPGTTNFKYVEKPTVKTIWAKKIYYDAQEIATQVPEVRLDKSTSINSIDIELDDLKELLWPYKRHLGIKLWEMLFTPDSLVEQEDRSARLWELECRLLEVGVPVSEVIKIAKASPWNKYQGRADEDKRILLEVLKAEKEVKALTIVSASDAGFNWVNYSQFLGQKIVGPGWMIEHIWADCSHGMIAGEPKTYKSIISTEMAISVASGFPMWDKYKVRRTGPVLMVQEENAPWVVQDRLIKIAHSKKLLRGRVYQVKKDDELYVEFPDELPIRILNNAGFDLTQLDYRDALVREIERTQPVLLILDPLYLMLGDVDENSARELRDTLHWLMQLKTEYRMSVIVLHHWNKGGKSERGGQRMLGSTTLHAWVESAMYTSLKDTKDKQVSIEREFRSFEKPDLLVVDISMSDPGVDPDYKVSLQPVTHGAHKYEGVEILPFIYTNPSATISEICAATGIKSIRTVRRRLEKYEEAGYLKSVVEGGKGRGKSTAYTLTEDGRSRVRGGGQY